MRVVPSAALGRPWTGSLRGGVPLPDAGPGFASWDPILKRLPNRLWRRYATDRLIATLEGVLAAHAAAHPGAQAVLVGDLSLPRGGPFGRRYGGLGHASHQNGLDADVYYPRADGQLRAADRPEEVDRRAAQSLVDAFVAAGAQYVFVGPHVHLHGRRKIVQVLVNHDDHLHVRLPPAPPQR